MATDTQSLGKLVVQLLLDDAGFNQDLEKSKGAIQSFGKGVVSVGKTVNSVFNALQLAAVGFAAASTMVGAGFEQQIQIIASLKGIADKTSDSYTQIVDKARELGASTAFSATEAATAMQALARAGQDVGTMIDTIGPALDFAGAAGASLEQSTTLLAATLSQFSLPAKDAARASDVFAVALKESQFAIDSLSEAMKQAGPTGAAFGQNLENVTAVVAQFKNLGLEGSSAGTVYKSMLVSLAKPTAEARDALEALGLTADQVNPSLNDMTDVIKTLGDAGATIDESLSIFGRRFGGNVDAVIQQTKTGVGSMNELLIKLQESSGQAGEMYTSMQETVIGQFNILKSGIEELMLSTFDTFKGPLTELLMELSKTVQFVADEFKKTSSSIGEDLQDGVGTAIDWLRENRMLIAQTFIDGARSVADLALALASIVPFLDEIAAGMAVIFAVSSAQKLGTALKGLLTTLGALRMGFKAFMVEVTTATGGIYALVLAIGALVASLIVVASKYRDAEKAAKQFRDSQAKQADVSKQAADQLLLDLSKELDTTKDLEDATRQQLASAGNLTAARKEELDLIREATKEELALGVARGQMIVHEGQLRTLRSLYEEIGIDAVPTAEKAIRALQEELGVLQSKAKSVSSLNDELSRFSTTGADAAARAKGFAGGMDELTISVGSFDSEITRVQSAIKELSKTNSDAQADLLQGYANDIPKALDKTGVAFKELEEDARKAAEMAEKAWTDAVNQAMQAGLTARRNAQNGLEDALATEGEALRIAHKRELQELQSSQDEAIALITDTLVERSIVEKQFAEARKTIVERQAIEASRAEIAAGFEVLRTKSELFKAERAERQRSLSVLTSLENASLKESERLRLELRDFIVDNSKLTIDEQIRANEVYRHRIEQAQKEERKSVRQHFIGIVKNATEAARDVVDGAKRIYGALSNITSQVLSTSSAVFSKIISLSKSAAKAAQSVFNALTGGGIDLGPLAAIVQALEKISSGEAAGSVADVALLLVKEIADNASLIVTGIVAALPEVIDGFLKMVPELISQVAAAIPGIVTIIVDAIPAMIQAIAESVPVVIDAFAKALPKVVAGLAAAIPGLIGVVAQNLSTVIRALVAALPDLIEAFAKAIPDLVQVLAENIPLVIQAVVANLPAVIQAIANSLPTLIATVAEQIPVLIQSLVNALPTLIDAIVSSLPTILDALLAGIPILIKGIVDALPTLIMALLNGILSIIPMLIEQVVVIVKAILGLLPDVIAAILAALPDIIRAIIKAIPEIITAILEAIPKIIMEIIKAIPDIIMAIVEEFPGMVTKLVMALLESIPAITWAIIDGIIFELIPRIPEITIQMVKSLAEGLWDLVTGIVDFIVDGLKDIFKRDKGETATYNPGSAEQAFNDIFSRDTSSNYSGLSYAPATMRGVTIHKGEAILDSDENNRRLFGGAGGSGQANPGAPVISGASSGGETSVNLSVGIDGRLIDRSIVRANQNGKGTIMSEMKRTAGVKSGVSSRPRFNPWRS